MVTRFISYRQAAVLGVIAVGVETVFSAATPNTPSRERIIAHLAPAVVPDLAHLLALVAGLALVVLAPKLWHGTRNAVPLAIGGLVVLAVLNVVKGFDYDEAALDLCLAAVLLRGRGAFRLGCRERPDLAALSAAVGAWALVYCALLVEPLVSDRGRTIKRALRTSFGSPHLSAAWRSFEEVLFGLALAISLLAVRSLLRPAGAANRHTEDEYRAARAIVERDGEDSLAPFILRPDKAFHFAAAGVLGYRVIGETAIVSGDPIAPDGAGLAVLASFRAFAHKQGWHVALWGASARNLDAYRELGLRAVCVGEEAFVEPGRFTLEGRRVRKLRQSVHRVTRRDWQLSACDGRELDEQVEREIDALDALWRAKQRRIVGFAMGMGEWSSDRRPGDMYLLGRSPGGELRAVIRFVDCCGRLSLDTMRRVGETPNGLNEALVCNALEIARERGVEEVSLNYAGLVRREPSRNPIARIGFRLVLAPLHRRFQMERLVHFNDKFSPEWRPRYLVYETRTALPRTLLRVLQAEGYVPELRQLGVPHRRLRMPREVLRPPRVKGAG